MEKFYSYSQLKQKKRINGDSFRLNYVTYIIIHDNSNNMKPSIKRDW